MHSFFGSSTLASSLLRLKRKCSFSSVALAACVSSCRRCWLTVSVDIVKSSTYFFFLFRGPVNILGTRGTFNWHVSFLAAFLRWSACRLRNLQVVGRHWYVYIFWSANLAFIVWCREIHALLKAIPRRCYCATGSIVRALKRLQGIQEELVEIWCTRYTYTRSKSSFRNRVGWCPSLGSSIYRAGAP